MTDIFTNDSDTRKPSKASPCRRYERNEKTTENLVGIGTTYIAMDQEEGTEVWWVEIGLVEANVVLMRHHLDTVLRFNHPNLLKCHTYWIAEENGEIRLYLIFEVMSTTLVHFVKRTKLNNKVIPIKTQLRIARNVLFAIAYLKNQNPPFYLPNLSAKIVFMTHDGSIKVSAITSNKIIGAILAGKPVMANDGVDPLYESFLNFGRIIYAEATLDLSSDDLSVLLRTAIEKDLFSPEQIDIITLILKNKNVTISNLLRSRFLFVFPALKIMAAMVILRQKIDFSNYNFDFPCDNVFATFVERSKEYYYSEVPSLDIDKYLTEVKQGLHPLTNIASSDVVRRSAEMSRNISPSSHTPALKHCFSNDLNDSSTLISFDDEINIRSDGCEKIIAIHCAVEQVVALSPPASPNLVKLKLNFLYQSMFCRHIESQISIDADTSPLSITDDLIDAKLISEKYKLYVLELVGRALNIFFSCPIQ
ncbi:hypothetical protein MXB_2287 [Myxobolus squamalis]|nr:hypothetical protein MXB_2287 [Myxobolus squamalis]